MKVKRPHIKPVSRIDSPQYLRARPGDVQPHIFVEMPPLSLYVAPAMSVRLPFQKWRTLNLAHVIDDEAVDLFRAGRIAEFVPKK